jgi:fructosamine-3-kinase
MTELFGGFGPDFYASYNASCPMDPGYGTRRELYNLYHVLNHLNLFGSGYLGRAEQMVEGLLAALR